MADGSDDRAAAPGEYAVLGGIIAEAYLGDGLLDGPQDPYLLKLRAVGQRAAEAEVLVVQIGRAHV